LEHDPQFDWRKYLPEMTLITRIDLQMAKLSVFLMLLRLRLNACGRLTKSRPEHGGVVLVSSNCLLKPNWKYYTMAK
jgi:hypothetical protein